MPSPAGNLPGSVGTGAIPACTPVFFYRCFISAAGDFFNRIFHCRQYYFCSQNIILVFI
ncbi:hypothetical protein X965_09165 [Morganella sp. EGD-HP17]|nr:hypothetical protein X965_09165 [Morganella sp. EGD-HP17]